MIYADKIVSKIKSLSILLDRDFKNLFPLCAVAKAIAARDRGLGGLILHHAAHAAATHWWHAAFLVFRIVGQHTLGGQQHRCDRSSVF